MWHVFLAQLQNSRISPEQLWVSACSLHSGTPTGRWVQLILASSAGSLIPPCTNYCSQQCPVHFALLIVFMAKFWALSLGLFFFMTYTVTTTLAKGIMFLDILHPCVTFWRTNLFFFLSYLAQMFTWSYGWTASVLVIWGQCYCNLTITAALFCGLWQTVMKLWQFHTDKITKWWPFEYRMSSLSRLGCRL